MAITTKPLLYLSLPGIALMIGFIYFRRQKKSRDEKNHSINDDINSDNLQLNDNKTTIKFDDKNLNKNLNHDYAIAGGKTLSTDITNIAKNYDVETETKFGKSAPINITYNGGGKSLSSTKFVNNNSVGIEDDEDEDDDDDSYSSSVDLPDSSHKKKRSIIRENYNNNAMMGNNFGTVEEPVIVKATVSPIISLSNSFPENKTYTENDENNELTVNNDNEEKTDENDEKHKIEEINNDISTSTTTATAIATVVVPAAEISIATATAPIKTYNDKESNQNSSPSISEFSAHSGDSGKGSSLPRSERLKTITYDFMLPVSLIGRFCGRRRTYINHIKSKSGVNITFKKPDITNKLRICSLMGTEKEIKIALSIIRGRFPLRRFPHLSLQKLEYAEPQTIVPLPLDYTSCLQLRLIEGINNDVIVISIITGNHIFVHHPTHPSYPSINILQDFINRSYETGEAPTLPKLADNAICVAKVNNLWYRVQIVNINDHIEDKCMIKFLDYGGYTHIDVENLRQIRADFMTMPFQATECQLSNIEPIDSEWTQEALQTLYHLTAGLVLQAQIVRYNDSNLPEVNLYAPLTKNSVIFINKEMVARGFAKWTTQQN